MYIVLSQLPAWAHPANHNLESIIVHGLYLPQFCVSSEHHHHSRLYFVPAAWLISPSFEGPEDDNLCGPSTITPRQKEPVVQE